MVRTPKKDKKPPRPAWMRSQKLQRFIMDLSEHGNVSWALEAAKLGRATVYERRQTDIEFEAAFENARQCGRECLIDEAHRRAYQGWEEARFHQGVKCGAIRKYSDTCLIFMIKRDHPEYRDSFNVGLHDAHGRPFVFQVSLHPDAVKAAESEAKK
jgi:hypothetical protein